MSKLYGRYTVTVPDAAGGELETFTFEPDEVTLAECVMIENYLDNEVPFEDWIRLIDQRRARAVQVLVWFLRAKAGRNQELHEVNVQIRKVDIEKLAAPLDADPEPPAGS